MAFDHTAPVAITVPNITFDNTSPVASALAAPAFDNNAPVPATVPGVTFDNTAPVAQTLASSTFDNAAPDPVTVPGVTFDNTNPQVGIIAGPNDAVTHTPSNYPAVTASLVPGVVVDGIKLRDGDVVLVPHQTVAAENGVYVCRPGNAIRHPLADSEAELVGLTVRVHGGSAQGYYFTQTTTAPITVGTTALIFTFALDTPTAKALPSSTFDNTAPVAIAIP